MVRDKDVKFVITLSASVLCSHTSMNLFYCNLRPRS